MLVSLLMSRQKKKGVEVNFMSLLCAVRYAYLVC